MTLHIFNPEHDIALATNVTRFTAPHAGRQLRADLGFLPALCAADGDMVLVDDVEAALEAVRHVRRLAAEVLFVTVQDMRLLVPQLSDVMMVKPWGWDLGVIEQLQQMGLQQQAPSEAQLASIRTLSSRQWAADHLLPVVRTVADGLIGEARYIDSFDALQDLMQAPGVVPSFQKEGCPKDGVVAGKVIEPQGRFRSEAEKVIEPQGRFRSEAEKELSTSQCLNPSTSFVLKAPWSSSGRGVRYVLNPDHWRHNAAWARNVIQKQGGIMVEPYYHKVKDFGMEFEACADGRVEYCGLSIFQTVNGAYTGSVIATERAKREMLSRYVSMQQLEAVRDSICATMSKALRGIYVGPFGVDMMIVASEDQNRFLMHPCVELNLRNTMGHVALSIPCDDSMPQRLMRIDYTNRYHLRIVETNENVLNSLML